MEIKDILDKMIEKLKPVDPYKIILYGPHARGTATSNKDIRLLVILDTDVVTKDPIENSKRNFEIITKNIGMDDYCRYHMNVVVQSRGENDQDKAREDFFICEIDNAGKVIYQKGTSIKP